MPLFTSLAPLGTKQKGYSNTFADSKAHLDGGWRQSGWTDGSTFGSFEYNKSVTGGSVTPSDEEKCEELNKKIQEIFKDSKWKIDFIEDSGTVSLPVEALPQA